MPRDMIPVRVVYNASAAQAALKVLGSVMGPKIFQAFSEFSHLFLERRTFDDRACLDEILRFWPKFCAISYGLVPLPPIPSSIRFDMETGVLGIWETDLLALAHVIKAEVATVSA